MAASSSSSSHRWSYDVFPSFRGEDVRNNFLSHCYKEFQRKGINTFKDQKIERGKTIAPELRQAIRESRISIVVLSKNYASSGWCLDELLEIMSCRDNEGQRVMAIFYGVDPRDVRDQTGDFGTTFKKTCARKTEVEEDKKQKWRQALTDVGNIAGYHYVPERDEEAKMIERIAVDVFKELNYTIVSRDFDGLVGIGTHIDKMSSLLCLKSKEVRMVAIWGPAGIGKTTLARVLYDRLSVLGDFQLTCFMDDIGKIFQRPCYNLYSYQLRLQEWFLSEIFDIKDLKIRNLGVAQERLNHQKVLVVLDDVDNKEQLEALAARMEWFGDGSRIIVTTDDKSILDAYGNSYVYEIDFPSDHEAMQIFCQYAFGQSFPPDGFQELSFEVVGLAGRLPLGLKVLGSSLRGMNKDEWKAALPRLRTSLNGKIEEVLRYSYICLDKKDQAIFRHIACLFTHEEVNRVISLLDDCDLNIKHGLNVLAKKCLIHINEYGELVMNNLLRQMGREIVHNQSTTKPRKREFLLDNKDIGDVLTQNIDRDATTLGISFTSEDGKYEMSINEKAFERMTNLQFFSFPLLIEHVRVKVHLPQRLSNLPHTLRLLHWDAYPLKSLPLDFCPKHLVELKMRWSELEKLWDGTKPLGRLKTLQLSDSRNLKEIPDLSKATNLESLVICNCPSLVWLPHSSNGHPSQLTNSDMTGCDNIEVLPPSNINLESLRHLNCRRCRQLRCFPEISQNLISLNLSGTAIDEVPSSVALWSRLTELDMSGCENLRTFPHVPNCIEIMKLDRTGITEVPSRIANLVRLHELDMSRCEKLRNISSNIFKLENLKILKFSGCRNLESFSTPLESPEFPREKVFAGLHLTSNDFESTLSQSKILYKPDTPESTYCQKLWIDGDKSIEGIPHSINADQEVGLRFIDCFKLNEEARQLIQESVCWYALLPGTELPSYITHRACGSSLTISTDKMPISGFFESKPYLLLAAILTNASWPLWDYINCRVKGQHGDVDFQRELTISYSHNDSFFRDFKSEHLLIFRIFDWPKEDDVPKDELSQDKRVLHFTCVPSKSTQLREFGIQLMDPAHVCEIEKSDTHADGSYQSESDDLSSGTDTNGSYQSESNGRPSNIDTNRGYQFESNGQPSDVDADEGHQPESNDPPSDNDPYLPWLLLL